MKFMMGWGWSCITIEPLEDFCNRTYFSMAVRYLGGWPGHMALYYIQQYIIYGLEHIALNDFNVVGDSKSSKDV